MAAKNPVSFIMDGIGDGISNIKKGADTLWKGDTVRAIGRAGDDASNYLNDDLTDDLKREVGHVQGIQARRNADSFADGEAKKTETIIKDIKKVEDLTLERDRQRARMKGLASAGRGSTLLTSPLGIVDDTLGSRGGKSLLGV